MIICQSVSFIVGAMLLLLFNKFSKEDSGGDGVLGLGGLSGLIPIVGLVLFVWPVAIQAIRFVGWMATLP